VGEDVEDDNGEKVLPVSSHICLSIICSSKIAFTMMATNLIICNNTEGIAAPSLLTTRIEVPKY
jgi:hypothetical protein